MMLDLRGRHLMQTVTQLSENMKGNLIVPTDLKPEGVAQIAESLNLLLADIFTLYLKTKNFHWHMSGPHFRDYHLLLDEQGAQIFAVTGAMAERVRKIGGTTLVPSARYQDCSAFSTTMRHLSRRSTCLPNCEMTIRSSHRACVRHTIFATNTVTLPARA